MKWLKRVTQIISYVAKCTDAISKAADVLATNWPTDSPFSSDTDAKEKGMVKDIQKL